MTSEVAQIRERIANEYMAAQWGLSGLASGTSKHQFITARMERMADGQKELAVCVGQEQAAKVLAEILVPLPDIPQRDTLVEVIKHLEGETEEMAHVLDALRDVWEKMDLLLTKFGQEDAYKMLMAPAVACERS